MLNKVTKPNGARHCDLKNAPAPAAKINNSIKAKRLKRLISCQFAASHKITLKPNKPAAKMNVPSAIWRARLAGSWFKPANSSSRVNWSGLSE